MISMFIAGGLIPIILISYAYEFLQLIGVRIIPRLGDMWVQTSYPNKILLVELVNGCILSFIIAYSLSLLM